MVLLAKHNTLLLELHVDSIDELAPRILPLMQRLIVWPQLTTLAFQLNLGTDPHIFF